MSENWRPVVGHVGSYEVSDTGRVRSLDRVVYQRGRYGQIYGRPVRGKELRPGRSSNGYVTVALGRGKSRTVHSLVAEAFIGPLPDGQDVRHLNGIRTDNRLANLAYGTRTENILDAIAHGSWFSEKRRRHIEKWRGNRHVVR